MSASLEDWLRLTLADGVGPVAVQQLLARFGSPAAVLRASPAELERAGLRSAIVRGLRAGADSARLKSALDWSAGSGQGALALDDPLYPQRLRVLSDPPPVLFHRGDLDLLGVPALAMVGSRNPTPDGAETAAAFAAHLAAAGLCIASGLARGVDAASHRGALGVGGLTLAVMGTGPDRIYPAAHRELAHQIIDSGGLILSELPPGTEPHAANFPRRNRLLSGLSTGVLVVEAGLRSGSLITARLAVEQGREVFAIPGSIHNPLARGCHALIRQGAKLVETAADVLEELAAGLQLSLSDAAAPTGPVEPPEALSDPDHQRLLDSFGADPVSIDRLVERSGFGAAEVASMLLILELQDRVAALPGGRYQRRVSPPA